MPGLRETGKGQPPVISRVGERIDIGFGSTRSADRHLHDGFQQGRYKEKSPVGVTPWAGMEAQLTRYP